MPRGLGGSRSGRPSLGLQTIINRLDANRRRVKKASAVPVTDDQATYASHVLEKNRGAGRRFLDATIAGSALNPLRVAGGAALEAGFKGENKGKRVSNALSAAGKTLWSSKLPKAVFEGGVAGAGIKGVQEGLEVGRARDTARRYIAQQEPQKVGQRLKLAEGLRKSLPALADKIRPGVPLRPLHPMQNDAFEFEV